MPTDKNSEEDREQIAPGLTSDQEKRLRTILDLLPAVVIVKDLELRHRYVNAAFEYVTQTKREDVIGKTDHDIFPKEVADIIREQDIKTIESKELTQNWGEVPHPDGTMHEYLNNKTPLLDDDGNVVELLIIAQDTNERKLHEEEKDKELYRNALIQTITVMARAIEQRDPYTFSHQQRVAELASAIAVELGLDDHRVEGVRMGGIIHDIGKIQISAEILNRPGKLSVNELALIKEHPEIGYQIIKHVDFPWPLANIVRQHHERTDGSGYPQGLEGNEICLEARILSVADVVEAMSSHRPYRPALGIDFALQEIERGRGKIYDSDAVDACIRLFKERGFEFDSSHY